MTFHGVTTITAPIDVVWDVFADVTAWPTWTASVRSVEVVEGGPLRLGAHVRIDQPRLPTLVWAVTALDNGLSRTWEAKRYGIHTLASHVLERVSDGATQVTQTIEQRGPIAAVAGLPYRRLINRYLDIEGRGLKLTAEQRFADNTHESSPDTR